MADGAFQRFRENDGFDKWDRWLAWPFVGLGLLFLVVLILPLATPLSPAQTSALSAANIAIWAAFAVDYLVRLYLALDRARFVRTHVLDLIVVVVPFLRPFRLLRLLAIVLSTSRRAGGLVVRRVTLYVVGVAVIVAATCAVIVYDAERRVDGSNIKSLGDALWWAVTTVTTVGYGDRYPTTSTGRTVAAILMVTGIALVGTITAAVAAWFVNAVRSAETAPVEERAEDEREELRLAISALTDEVRALRNEVRGASRDSQSASRP